MQDTDSSRSGLLRAPIGQTLWLWFQLGLVFLIAGIPAGFYAHDLDLILQALSPFPAVPSPPLGIGEIVVSLGILALPFVWTWPIGRYLDTRREDLRDAARRRFRGLFAFIAWYYAANAAQGVVGIAWLMARTGRPFETKSFLLGAVVPSVFSVFYALYFIQMCLEPLLFQRIAPLLYEGDGLYERKSGPMPRVRTKLFLMIVFLIAVPMALVAASMHFGLTRWTQGFGVAVLTAACAIGYGETLYRSIAAPLAELNEKMSRVGAGDYAAKAVVLADDEIGTLRWRFNEMVDGLAERERLKETFGRYVSVEVAKRLIESGAVALGGENVQATVLFSDIRDFTPLSESLAPQELVALLNSYFSYVTEPVAKHHGVVNKFIGDAVMAVFTPQLGSADHARDAVLAALEMRDKLAEFNAGRPSEKPVRAGVGVHTGPLVAGNIGTQTRMEYTVIGDTVNIAARIESKTKELDCSVLISEDTFRALGAEADGLMAERCENVRVKGKEKPLVLYKLPAQTV